MKKPVYAMVVCNSFYASCEKLFCPDLHNTLAIVLSNNVGCVVARSKEAKALGLKMGGYLQTFISNLITIGIKL